MGGDAEMDFIYWINRDIPSRHLQCSRFVCFTFMSLECYPLWPWVWVETWKVGGRFIEDCSFRHSFFFGTCWFSIWVLTVLPINKPALPCSALPCLAFHIKPNSWGQLSWSCVMLSPHCCNSCGDRLNLFKEMLTVKWRMCVQIGCAVMYIICSLIFIFKMWPCDYFSTMNKIFLLQQMFRVL